jgi:hypothetical protein
MAEEAAPPEQEELVDPFALFSDKTQRAVEGLTYLGQLSDTIKFCGHTFEIRTLLPQHKFAISLALQPYRNTIHEVDVYEALHVGMSVTAVDGDSNYCPPIGPDLEGLCKARLSYVGENWYPPTVSFLWNRYVLLETTAAKAIQELDRLSQGGQPQNLPPWLDSLIEQGRSQEPTNSDTPPSTPFK